MQTNGFLSILTRKEAQGDVQRTEVRQRRVNFLPKGNDFFEKEVDTNELMKIVVIVDWGRASTMS